MTWSTTRHIDMSHLCGKTSFLPLSLKKLASVVSRKCSNVCKAAPVAETKVKSGQDMLKEFGGYVQECLPKFVQKVHLNHCKELEIMIAPEGVVPTMQVILYSYKEMYIAVVGVD